MCRCINCSFRKNQYFQYETTGYEQRIRISKSNDKGVYK